MKKRAKVICSLLIFIFCMMIAVPVVAAEPTNSQEAIIDLPAYNLGEGIIQPYFTYITVFQSYFDINSWGKAVIDVSIRASGMDEIRIYSYLQRYNRGQGKWESIRSWSKTSTTDFCYVTGEYYVYSGYSYRVVSYGYIYVNGQLVESDTMVTRTINH